MARPLLARMVLVLHAGLAVAVAGTVMTFGFSTALRLALSAIACLPLALLVPGLFAARRNTLRWLAVWLVLYTGLASVEVIATGTRAAAAFLLLALLELALTLSLLRHSPPQSPAATGES